MQIGAIEQQQRDRVRAIREKFFPVKKKATLVKLVAYVAPDKPVEWLPPKPEWKKQDIYFDAHVIESRRILEMLKSGEIELSTMTHRAIREIVEETLKDFPDVGIRQIRGISRCRTIVSARQECMWRVRQERADLSYPAIGRWFGGRDHTTVLHSVRKIQAKKDKRDGMATN